MVRHIRNRHGGRLAIESMLGQEATFTAHMPSALASGENRQVPIRTWSVIQLSSIDHRTMT